MLGDEKTTEALKEIAHRSHQVLHQVALGDVNPYDVSTSNDELESEPAQARRYLESLAEGVGLTDPEEIELAVWETLDELADLLYLAILISRDLDIENVARFCSDEDSLVTLIAVFLDAKANGLPESYLKLALADNFIHAPRDERLMMAILYSEEIEGTNTSLTGMFLENLLQALDEVPTADDLLARETFGMIRARLLSVKPDTSEYGYKARSNPLPLDHDSWQTLIGTTERTLRYHLAGQPLPISTQDIPNFESLLTSLKANIITTHLT